jgi:hypothetical protein
VPTKLPELTALQLESLVSPARAAEMRGCSVDTLYRVFAGKFVRISPHRVALRVRDVIAETPGPPIPPPKRKTGSKARKRPTQRKQAAS